MEKFNPLSDIFDKPETGSPLEQDFESMETGALHNTAMFDQQDEAHGGEKVNPATGKANENVDVGDADGVGMEELERKGEDLLGDIKDPRKMSLEELLATQDEDII